MNSNVYMIARPVKWNVLEDFYKGVKGGLDKLAKMKELCRFRAEEYFGEPRLREAEVNMEFLFDRRQKQNAEFIWTEENIDKLVRLDQHIRKLEYELYKKFVGIKKNLDGLIAQGFNDYRDYQVTGKIDYDEMYIDDEGHERKKDWVSGLLQDYAT